MLNRESSKSAIAAASFAGVLTPKEETEKGRFCDSTLLLSARRTEFAGTRTN